MQASIRELAVHEVTLLRQLRLRALKDSPGEFGESLAEAKTHPADYWDGITGGLTGESPQRMFIAESAGQPVGSVYALGDANDHEAARLGGMWVDSSVRCHGIGSQLTDAVVSWARKRGLKRIGLWVADADTPAHRLYLRAGFVDTAIRDTTRAKIDKDLIAMTLDITSLDQ